MKRSLAPYGLIALGLLFLFVCLIESSASNTRQAYLKLYSLYMFEYSDMPPFETIRPMAWNAETGFHEISQAPDYLYTFVYLEDGLLRHGYVMQDAVSGDCFYLEMQTDDEMGNPHVDRHEWVTCPD